MKIRNKIVVLGLVALSLFVTACGKVRTGSTTESTTSDFEASGEDAISLDAKSLADDIKKEGKFKDQLAEVEADIAINRLYQLDSGKLSDYCFYTNTGATAEEIAVVKVNDDSYLKNIEEAFNKRVESQKEACSDYLPDEMPKLDKAVVKTVGSYVIFVVSEDSAKAEGIIDKLTN